MACPCLGNLGRIRIQLLQGYTTLALHCAKKLHTHHCNKMAMVASNRSWKRGPTAIADAKKGWSARCPQSRMRFQTQVGKRTHGDSIGHLRHGVRSKKTLVLVLGHQKLA